jgi:hypothetical protein
MSLICAVPSYAELSAATGQDVIVINGHSAVRLRLDEVAPVLRGGRLFFRAVLRGQPETVVREGTHLSRIGDFLVRLHLTRVEAEDGSAAYEAHAQAHLDHFEADLGELVPVAS